MGSKFQHKIDIVGRDKASGAFRAVGKSTQSFGRKLADTTATISHTINIVKSLGQAMRNMARPFAAASKAFAEFEKAMVEVSTIADVNEQQFEALSKTVSDFSRKYATEAADTARALYQTISAGNTDVEDATKVMSASMKFGRSAIVDSSIAVDLMTTVMNSYGMSADQATEASDVLFTTIRMGKTTGEELAGAFGRVTAIAARAGVSLKDLGASTAALTLGGLKTEEAMTALRQVIVSIAKPTEQSKEAIAELNLEFFNEDVLRQRGGLFKIIDELAVASEDSIQTLSGVIPNIRALVGALTIAGQGDRIASLMEEFANAGGATETALAKIMASYDFRLAKTRAEFEALKRATGESISENEDFLGALETIGSMLAVVADTVTDNKNEFAKMKFGLQDLAKTWIPATIDAFAYLIETLAGGTGLSKALVGITNTFGMFTKLVQISANGYAQLIFGMKALRAQFNGSSAESEAFYAQMLNIQAEGRKMWAQLKVKATTGFLVEENKELMSFAESIRVTADLLRDKFKDEGNEITVIGMPDGDAVEAYRERVKLMMPDGDAAEAYRERVKLMNEEAAEEVELLWAGFWEDRIEVMREYGDQIGAALGDSITNALTDQSQTWKENFTEFGESAKTTVLDSILDPIFGAGSALNELFAAVLTPLNVIGQAINDHLFKPMIDGILKFFTIKKVQEKAATAESSMTQAAGALATASTTNAATAAMLPLLSAAATASAIASFGSTLAFGPMAQVAIAQALAAAQAMGAVNQIPVPKAEGGRITERGIFEVGERGEELILPETRTVRARSLLRDLYRRRPELSPESALRGSQSVFNINVSSLGSDASEIARAVADEVSALIAQDAYA